MLVLNRTVEAPALRDSDRLLAAARTSLKSADLKIDRQALV